MSVTHLPTVAGRSCRRRRARGITPIPGAWRRRALINIKHMSTGLLQSIPHCMY
jgi:hypothetical protein